MHCLLTLLVLIFSCLSVAAQGFGGYVVDSKGVAIVGATVIERRTLVGAITDNDGHFAIRYRDSYPTTAIVRCIGFRTDTIYIGSRTDNLRVVMQVEEIESQEVNVVGKRHETNFETIDASIAAQVPTVDGGIEGVIKSQLGVSSNSELSSQYRVRGGNFDENLVYVNGIEIYRPFLIRAGEQEGLSFANPDMVQELNFSAGGFDASYGDKLSSVLDVTYKQPHETHVGGRISLLGASLHAEGSIRGGQVTHITGFRYKTNQYLFGSLDTKGDYSPTFLDVQTYWTVNPSPRLQLGALAYFASNKYRFVPADRETNFGTYSDAKSLTIYFEGKENDKYLTCVAATSAQVRLSDQLSLDATLSMFRTQEEEYYDILGEYWLQQAYDSQSETAVDQSTNIGVGGYMQHARNNLFGTVYSASASAILRSELNTLKAQIKLVSEHYSDWTDEWEYTDSAGYITSPSIGHLEMTEQRYAHNILDQTRIEGYLLNKLIPITIGNGTIRLTTGVRIAHQTTNNATIYSPRLQLGYNTGNWRLRLATGRYSQLPNLREMKQADATLNLTVKPQKSWQLIGGADLFFGTDERPMKFTAELYYKWLRRLNPYSIDNVRLRYEANNNAEGYAAGIDLKLNGELVKGADSWVTLSLMKTAEDISGDGHGYIPRPSDQRVQFSMMVQDYMPNNKSITAMLSMYFGTGLPFGPSGCERWQATNRMPGYKRVDLGAYKDFAINAEGENSSRTIKTAKLGIEIFNLFDISNTISYFWVKDDDGNRYGVPNYLTSRRINAKLTIEF